MPRGIGGEVGWYCPSLDVAGNGTSTLTDFAGSNNGALQAMESGDWVADTTAGGVRCLEFGGTDEYVTGFPGSLFASRSQLSVTFWFKRSASPTASSSRVLLGPSPFSNGALGIQIWSDSFFYVSPVNATNYASFGQSDTNWHNIAVVYDGTATGNSNRLKIYLDGTSQSLAFVGTIAASTGASTGRWDIGRGDSTIGQGRVDDIRLFQRVLTQAEITRLASKRGYEPTLKSGTNLLTGLAG